MNGLSGIFLDTARVFLAVVHVKDERQTLRNVEIAKHNGAHGVFLINHAVHRSELLTIYEVVRETYPSLWLGLNILGLENNEDVIHMASLIPDLNGLWLDDVGYHEHDIDPCKEVRRIRQWQTKYGLTQTIIFGGIAFKYRPPVVEVARAAQFVTPFLDVITTSGSATGVAPDVEKICSMKEAVGDHALAIASGMTPENIHLYLPYADCFLVATGISRNETDLDPQKVASLSAVIRSWK